MISGWAGAGRWGRGHKLTVGGWSKSLGSSLCDAIKMEKVHCLPLEETHTSEVGPCECCPWRRQGEVWLSFQGPTAALSGFLGRFLYGIVPGSAKKSSILTPLLPVELFLHPSFPVFFLSFLPQSGIWLLSSLSHSL